MSFERLKILGEGSYGKVDAIRRKGEPHELALKTNLVPKEADGICSLLELDFLVSSEHPYITRIKSYAFNSPFGEKTREYTDTREDHLYFIFEKAHCTLYNLISGKEPLIPSHAFQAVLMQILLSLEYLHIRGAIHRDLKPENILYFEFDQPDPNSGLTYAMKLCDFGLACYPCPAATLTRTVVTEYYRAPEIYLGASYDTAIDIWSLGAIFYEMLYRHSFAADNPKESLLVRILSKIPIKPTLGEVLILNKTRSRDVIIKQYQNAKTNLLPLGDPVAWDLLKGLLQFNPKDRLTATQALAHPYFNEYQEFIQKIRALYHHPLPVCSITIGDRTPINKVLDHKRRIRDKDGHTYYPLRVLCQSLSLYDRYLERRRPQDNLTLVAEICFYLCYKYFTPTEWKKSFSHICNYQGCTKDTLFEIEEYILTEVCRLHLYQPTPYEALPDVLTPEQEQRFYLFYSRLSTGSYVAKDVVTSWLRTESSDNLPI